MFWGVNSLSGSMKGKFTCSHIWGGVVSIEQQHRLNETCRRQLADDIWDQTVFSQEESAPFGTDKPMLNKAGPHLQLLNVTPLL